jgi:peptidoglycan/xylan/chitin deacetylase (PgdA/CDA1 family)
MYFPKTPSFVQQMLSQYTWKVDTQKKRLYLTFDDGPTPEITTWVSEQLDQYQAKGTFFVLGKNVARHPEITHTLLDNGHSLGNHSYSHPDGWKTSLFRYLLDFKRGQQAISEYTGAKTLLYRPPYGRINRKQGSFIQQSHRIVMMDVMPGDFDCSIDKETCLERALSRSGRGSIICLHDSKKAWPHLQYVLPRLLEHFAKEGYQFRALNPIPEQLSATH